MQFTTILAAFALTAAASACFTQCPPIQPMRRSIGLTSYARHVISGVAGNKTETHGEQAATHFKEVEAHIQEAKVHAAHPNVAAVHIAQAETHFEAGVTHV